MLNLVLGLMWVLVLVIAGFEFDTVAAFGLNVGVECECYLSSEFGVDVGFKVGVDCQFNLGLMLVFFLALICCCACGFHADWGIGLDVDVGFGVDCGYESGLGFGVGY